MPSSGEQSAARGSGLGENKRALPFTACLKGLVMWLWAVEFFLLIFIQAHKASRPRQQKRSAGILNSLSPLSQHNNFGLRLTPLAEGEELADDAPRLAQELLGAELQLLVALVDGRLRLPEVLDGGRVQGVEGGEPPDEVLKLIWKAGRQSDMWDEFGGFFSSTRRNNPLIPFQLYLANSFWANETLLAEALLAHKPRGKLGVILFDAYANRKRQS